METWPSCAASVLGTIVSMEMSSSFIGLVSTAETMSIDTRPTGEKPIEGLDWMNRPARKTT